MAWNACYCPDFQAASVVGALAGTTATNDRRLINNVSGTPTFVADVIDVGRHAVRCDSGTTATKLGQATMGATRYCGGIARFRVQTSAFTNAIELFGVAAGTGTNSVWVRAAQTTGEIQYTFGGSTGAYTGSGVFIAPQSVYQAEMFVDFNTGTTHTLKFRLNGVEILNVTGGTAIDTVAASGFYCGANDIATSMIVDYSDMATYNDVAQYATVNDCRVYGLEPISDGTHSMTASDFQDNASTNLSNATTTSWQLIDDAPGRAPDVTDFVQQVVLRATSHMEWNLRALTIPSNLSASAPLLVSLAAAMHPVAAATANTVAFRLNSGGNVSAEAAIDTSVASNTLEFRHHFYNTEPSTAAAWTLAMAAALKAQFGFSSDATPPPALDAIMAFVVVPVTPVAILPDIPPGENLPVSNQVLGSHQIGRTY